MTSHSPACNFFSRSQFVLCALCVFAANLSSAGPLTPPAGPVAPTTGPEPRTPIDAAHTPGDADSVFKITIPGSYYLADNVSGAAGKMGIEILASGVTIDLMGFRLQGAVGSLNGIATSGGVRTQIIIRNGTISAWGLDGIDLTSSGIGSDCTLENIHAITNAGDGIVAFNHAAIRNCVTRGNGANGIQSTANAVVSGCVSAENGGSGVVVGASSCVTNCSARENTGFGISGGSGSVIAECAAYLNGSTGITSTSHSNIRGCSSYDNGTIGISVVLNSTVQNCTASSNGTHGIATNTACTVQQCSALANGSHGIFFSSDCLITWNTCDGNGTAIADGAGLFSTNSNSRIDSNHCTDNDYGIRLTAASNLVVRNTCSGNTAANYDFILGNHYGAIVTRAGVLSPAVSGDAAGSSLTTTDPHANFTY